MYAERDYFNRHDPYYLHHIGFFLGMYHGGVLSPHTGQLRPNVTTLASLDHQDAKRGYRAGREYLFVDAEPHQQKFTETQLVERLRESVNEMVSWKDVDGTWFFSVGCVLGELSGQLFPMDEQEREGYLSQYQRLRQTRQRHRAAQEQAVHHVILQKAEVH